MPCIGSPTSAIRAGIVSTVNAAGSSDTVEQALPLAVALEEPERRIIETALKRNSYNRQATAAELDINRTTLYKKMRKYQLDVGESN